MIVEQSTDAISHRNKGEDWRQINWRKAYVAVKRLQTRIVKAVNEGNWRKAKALQRLLDHSYYGCCLAVRRVTENKGKKTPGIDGVLWKTPQDKTQAVQKLKQTGYKALPLRRIYIPKKNGKKRPLGIPTMQDRAKQALHLLALEPIAETQADGNSYGFRTARSAHDAIEQLFTCLARSTSARWVLEGDIQACFDEISHKWMKTHLPMHKNTLNQWLNCGYMEREVFLQTKKGTPQGGIASPVMANTVLDGLEELVADLKNKVHFVRYADDFVITGMSKNHLETVIKPKIIAFFKARGLTLSEEKTRITHIDKGFDFLGFTLRKFKGKLLIKPSKESVKRMLGKVRDIIKSNAQCKQVDLIKRLNPVIRGWAYYYRSGVSKDTFDTVDDQIFQSLWRWAKRRHPHKSLKWVRKKYFTSDQHRQWQFTKLTADGKTISLFRAATIPIQRHVKIRAYANPFDPEWELYFEQRLSKKWRKQKRGKITQLWLQQKGVCPVCKQRITYEQGFHVHHKVHRCNGGGDENENLVLLHAVCHQQVHSKIQT